VEVTDADGVPVAVRVGVTLGVAVTVAVCEMLTVMVGDTEPVGVRDGVADGSRRHREKPSTASADS
jgi:hypothetical protein